jgi:adenosine deaminase CECR1
MVHRGLYCSEKRISSFDSWYVLTLFWEPSFETVQGFDLVGYENDLQPIIYYLPMLLKFRERQAEEGVEIPFYFHAGETFGDGSRADDNLYDAILLGTKRIGHGLEDFYAHPCLGELT